ncbi:hypothetical protein LINGRAHAP2_LOCUS14234 [Linum grandiflorum]
MHVSTPSEDLPYLRIDEDSARPFFPLESFNIATMPAMRAIAQPRTSSLDIIGRLSGVTRPTPSPTGGLFFKLLLDHASGDRFTIRYSCFRPPTPVDLNSIAVLERRHPVICILTAVTVTNPGGCSDATTTTNIIFSGAAASLLFRMLPEEYVLLSDSQENALLTDLQGAMLTDLQGAMFSS